MHYTTRGISCTCRDNGRCRVGFFFFCLSPLEQSDGVVLLTKKKSFFLLSSSFFFLLLFFFFLLLAVRRYATTLLHRDPSFSEELYEMAQAIDVDQYIALRPAPIVGPVAAARRNRTLSRRWMAALSDPIDTRSTSIRVEEMARLEDPGHIDFLERRVQYTSTDGAGLPWHQETMIPSPTGGVQKNMKKGSGSTRQRRGILHSMHKSMTPERTRSFSAHVGSSGSTTGGASHSSSSSSSGASANGNLGGDRMFAPVSLTQNLFQNVVSDHNSSGLPLTEDVSNIKARLKDLGVNRSASLSSLSGTARYVNESVSTHDQANSRRSILRDQISRGRIGNTTLKTLSKKSRQRKGGGKNRSKKK